MVYFLIPLYNEEQNLEDLINSLERVMRILDKRYKIIFVNDGSTDNSIRIIEVHQKLTNNIILLSHYPNRGVRGTFDVGFKKFLEVARMGDILITQEADNTSDTKILGQMLNAVTTGKCDVALASCYMENGKIINSSYCRKFLSTSANILVKIRFNLWKYHTFSSFYRAFTYRSIKSLYSSYDEVMTINGFCCVVEMLIKLIKLKMKIIEIPLVLDATKRLGKSKMRIAKTIKGYFKLICSIV